MELKKNIREIILRVMAFKDEGFRIIEGINIPPEATSGYDPEKKVAQQALLHLINLATECMDWAMKAKNEEDLLKQSKNMDHLEKRIKGYEKYVDKNLKTKN
jgi:hypothetical protein|tara:strand:+ start:514 stop:819 length:306 start_codon:yes stop_codon:yes gene_type:complete